MAYDLLLKNGRVVDGSGMPSFFGDVAVNNGKIAAIGKLGSSATRVIDADGMVVSPGFIDNHCHYDAQVLGPAVQLFLLPRRHHRDHRQLLPGPGASAARH